MGQQTNGNWDYFAYDGLGSVRGLMDGGGALTYSASYDPYGELMSASSGTGGSNLGYAGEYTDSNGLVYLRARYMNPASGTFLSKDPFEGWMEVVMSRNGYSYVHGNPVMYIDPTGEAAASIWRTLMRQSTCPTCRNSSPFPLGLDRHQDCYVNFDGRLVCSGDIPFPEPPWLLPRPLAEDLARAVQDGVDQLGDAISRVLNPDRSRADDCPEPDKTCASEYSGYKLCRELNGYNESPSGGFIQYASYRYQTMDALINDLAVEPNRVVLHFNNSGRPRANPRDTWIQWDSNSVVLPGDRVTTGPCVESTGAAYHWNYFSTMRRWRDRANIQPEYAVASCRCCDEGNGEPFLTTRYAVINRGW